MKILIKKQLGCITVLEKLIVLQLILGCFMTNRFLLIIRYSIGLFVQLFLLFFYIANDVKVKRKSPFVKYLICLAIIFVIAVLFFFMKIDDVTIINRVLPLLSVFGIVILGEQKYGININEIAFKFVKIYILLILIVNLDAIIFMITGRGIWIPISYLGYRYSGFFNDPNFMAIFSAVVFIILLKSKENYNNIYRVIGMVILIINILLARALSTYILLTFVLLINKFISLKISLKKQVLFICAYLAVIFFYSNFKSEFMEFFIYILKHTYGDINRATIKYGSLTARFDTQLTAIKLIIERWWGYGPRQIVPFLGLDTHNSYIGITFEQGLLGLILILVSLKRKIENSMASYVGMFLMLSALLINIHYTAIYSLFLIVQYLPVDKQSTASKYISRLAKYRMKFKIKI